MADVNSVEHLVHHDKESVANGYDNNGFHPCDRKGDEEESSNDDDRLRIVVTENGRRTDGDVPLPNGHAHERSNSHSTSTVNGTAVVVLGEEDDDHQDVTDHSHTDSTQNPLDTRLRHYVPADDMDRKILNGSDSTHVSIPDDAVISFTTGGRVRVKNRLSSSPQSTRESIPLETIPTSYEVDDKKALGLEKKAEVEAELSNSKNGVWSAETHGAEGVFNSEKLNGTSKSSDEVSLPVNSHRKCLSREGSLSSLSETKSTGEKLYFTEENRKLCPGWRRLILCGLILIIVAVAVCLAVLAATGILLAESDSKTIRHESGHSLPSVDTISQAGFPVRRPSSNVPQKFQPSVTTEEVHLPNVTATHGVQDTVSQAPPKVTPKVPLLIDSSHSQTIVPNALVGEFTIIDEIFTDDLNDKNSQYYLTLANNLEKELRRIFQGNRVEFEKLYILSFRPGSIRVKFVMIWIPNHPVISSSKASEILAADLGRKNNSFFNLFHVDMNSIHFTEAFDECRIQKGGCTYDCSWNYDTLVKLCICPANTYLLPDGKSCGFKESSTAIAFTEPKQQPPSTPVFRTEAFTTTSKPRQDVSSFSPSIGQRITTKQLPTETTTFKFTEREIDSDRYTTLQYTASNTFTPTEKSNAEHTTEKYETTKLKSEAGETIRKETTLSEKSTIAFTTPMSHISTVRDLLPNGKTTTLNYDRKESFNPTEATPMNDLEAETTGITELTTISDTKLATISETEITTILDAETILPETILVETTPRGAEVDEATLNTATHNETSIFDQTTPYVTPDEPLTVSSTYKDIIEDKTTLKYHIIETPTEVYTVNPFFGYSTEFTEKSTETITTKSETLTPEVAETLSYKTTMASKNTDRMQTDITKSEFTTKSTTKDGELWEKEMEVTTLLPEIDTTTYFSEKTPQTSKPPTEPPLTKSVNGSEDELTTTEAPITPTTLQLPFLTPQSNRTPGVRSYDNFSDFEHFTHIYEETGINIDNATINPFTDITTASISDTTPIDNISSTEHNLKKETVTTVLSEDFPDPILKENASVITTNVFTTPYAENHTEITTSIPEIDTFSYRKPGLLEGTTVNNFMHTATTFSNPLNESGTTMPPDISSISNYSTSETFPANQETAHTTPPGIGVTVTETLEETTTGITEEETVQTETETEVPTTTGFQESETITTFSPKMDDFTTLVTTVVDEEFLHGNKTENLTLQPDNTSVDTTKTPFVTTVAMEKGTKTTPTDLTETIETYEVTTITPFGETETPIDELETETTPSSFKPELTTQIGRITTQKPTTTNTFPTTPEITTPFIKNLHDFDHGTTTFEKTNMSSVTGTIRENIETTTRETTEDYNTTNGYATEITSATTPEPSTFEKNVPENETVTTISETPNVSSEAETTPYEINGMETTTAFQMDNETEAFNETVEFFTEPTTVTNDAETAITEMDTTMQKSEITEATVNASEATTTESTINVTESTTSEATVNATVATTSELKINAAESTTAYAEATLPSTNILDSETTVLYDYTTATLITENDTTTETPIDLKTVDTQDQNVTETTETGEDVSFAFNETSENFTSELTPATNFNVSDGNFNYNEDSTNFTTPGYDEVINETTTIADIGIECREDQFICEPLNICLNNSFMCDGILDCTDGTDEFDCQDSCHTNFKCSNSSTCIMNEARCDGIWDCDNGTDEEYCRPAECAKHEVMCSDGSKCIKPVDICDWKYDCKDRSDEVGCVERTTCESNGKFFCDDGLCIPWSLKCDGEFDCKDKEDEGNCTCLNDEFQCSDGKCLKSSSRCDGHRDCHDGDDEMGCVTVDAQHMVTTYEPYSGTWAMLCAEDFNLDDGHYLCQELGFGHALKVDKLHVSFNGTWMAMRRENLTDASLWTERVSFVESCTSSLAAEVECQKFACGEYTGLLHRRKKRDILSSSTSSQWPFIGYTSTFRSNRGCLSEILTPIWLLTSADCLLSISKNPFNGSDWYVRTNIGQNTETGLAQNHEVLRIILHPHSSKFRSLILRDYDVALVRLKHALVFVSDKIGAICPPEEQVPPGITCFSGVLGTEKPRAPPPPELSINSLALQIIDRKNCNTVDHYNNSVNQRMLCTQSSEGHTICDNDEGTPLMCLTGINQWFLAGMLTYQRYCEVYSKHPAVFSNLFSMRKYIDQVTGQKQYEIPYDSNIYVIIPPTTPSPTVPETTTAIYTTTETLTTTEFPETATMNDTEDYNITESDISTDFTTDTIPDLNVTETSTENAAMLPPAIIEELREESLTTPATYTLGTGLMNLSNESHTTVSDLLFRTEVGDTTTVAPHLLKEEYMAPPGGNFSETTTLMEEFATTNASEYLLSENATETVTDQATTLPAETETEVHNNIDALTLDAETTELPFSSLTTDMPSVTTTEPMENNYESNFTSNNFTEVPFSKVLELPTLNKTVTAEMNSTTVESSSNSTLTTVPDFTVTDAESTTFNANFPEEFTTLNTGTDTTATEVTETKTFIFDVKPDEDLAFDVFTGKEGIRVESPARMANFESTAVYKEHLSRSRNLDESHNISDIIYDVTTNPVTDVTFSDNMTDLTLPVIEKLTTVEDFSMKKHTTMQENDKLVSDRATTMSSISKTDKEITNTEKATTTETYKPTALPYYATTLSEEKRTHIGKETTHAPQFETTANMKDMKTEVTAHNIMVNPTILPIFETKDVTKIASHPTLTTVESLEKLETQQTTREASVNSQTHASVASSTPGTGTESRSTLAGNFTETETTTISPVEEETLPITEQITTVSNYETTVAATNQYERQPKFERIFGETETTLTETTLPTTEAPTEPNVITTQIPEHNFPNNNETTKTNLSNRETTIAGAEETTVTREGTQLTTFANIVRTETTPSPSITSSSTLIDNFQENKSISTTGIKETTPTPITIPDIEFIDSAMPRNNNESLLIHLSSDRLTISEEEKETNYSAKCGQWDHIYNETSMNSTKFYEEWPALGYLQLVSEPKMCAATILSSHYVLSSLNCLSYADETLNPDKWAFVGGLYDSMNVTGQQTHLISEILQHENASSVLMFHEHNLALVRVKDEIPLTRYSQTACLAEDLELQEPCFTTGWSQLPTGVKQEEEFYSVPVNIIPQSECNGTMNYNGLLLDTLICASHDNSSNPTCQMDYGSPLFCLNNKQWQLKGILDFPGPCDIVQPAVYNSISSAKTWIMGYIGSKNL